MPVTSLEEIKKLAGAREIELPFDEGQTITVKLRRVSLLTLVSEGSIPNGLLGTVYELFGMNDNKGKKDEEDEDKDISSMVNVIDVMCEASLLEPTYAELKEYLTDDLKLLIFSYAQEGVRALDTFRKEQENNKLIKHGKAVPKKTKRDN